MNNNDILIRLRYALDMRDIDMLEMFKLGGVEITRDELRTILTKQDPDLEPDAVLDYHTLEAFLNGFIIFNRGEAPAKNGVKPEPTFLIRTGRQVNNVMVKKLKIALSLTSDDIIDLLALANVNVTPGEISAILRNEKHRNYKVCGDRYARNFLKGIMLRNRGEN